MSIGTGISAMKEAQKKIKKSMESGGSKYIGIGDTESFLFRFMQDEEGIVNGYFHRVPMEQGDRSWTQDTLCTEDDCPYCSSNDPAISKRSYKFLTWIWVYYRLNSKPDEDGKWEPTERDGETFYKEIIDRPMILKQGYYFSRVMTGVYAKYKTLIDRDYECIRSGVGLDTAYSLFGEDKKAMPKKIKEAVKDLEDIEDILRGADRKKVSASVPKKRSVVDEEVEEYDDDDDDDIDFD